MTRGRKAAIAAAVVAVLVLAGAGAALLLGRGGSTANAQASAPLQQRSAGGSRPTSAAFQQFRQCLEKNGVAAGTGRRPDRSDPTFQKALQACAQYAPPGFPGGPGGGGGFGGPPNQSGA